MEPVAVVANMISPLLGRPLRVEEQEMLSFISPQGVAKINSDIGRGAKVEDTLTDLMQVYQTLKRRRKQAEQMLGPPAQTILSGLRRPPTIEEMVLMVDIPPLTLEAKIGELLDEGEALEDIIEELALEHRQQLLLFDAHRISADKGKPVAITRLAPTLKPQNPSSLSSLRRQQFGDAKLRLGLSPLVSWFEDTPNSMCKRTFDSDSLVVHSPATAPSLVRSALKSPFTSRSFSRASSFSSSCLSREISFDCGSATPSTSNDADEVGSVGYSCSSPSFSAVASNNGSGSVAGDIVSRLPSFSNPSTPTIAASQASFASSCSSASRVSFALDKEPRADRTQGSSKSARPRRHSSPTPDASKTADGILVINMIDQPLNQTRPSTSSSRISNSLSTTASVCKRKLKSLFS